MDAKDRLRRYLEQRRELGESELVLDSLSIDDVMKMVGAKSSASKGGSASTTAKARAQTPVDRAGAAPSADAPQAVPSAPVVPMRRPLLKPCWHIPIWRRPKSSSGPLKLRQRSL